MNENTRLTLHEARGPLMDLIEKLSTPNGAKVLENLKRMLRSNETSTASSVDVVVINRPNLCHRELPIGVAPLMKPKLLRVGPTSYSLYDLQKIAPIGPDKKLITNGADIYEYLESNNLLEQCLGYEDLEAILEKDVNIITSVCGNYVVSFWKGAVRNVLGEMVIPCLYPDRIGKPMIDWRPFSASWEFSNFKCPAGKHILLFPKP